MAQLISGLYDSAFYQMIQGALAARGYASIADFLAQEPNYWFNEEEWRQVYDLAPVENPTRVFEQKIGGVSVPIMAAYIADEARSPLMATEGFSKETGEIPRMGRGYAFDVAAYEAIQQAQRNGVDVNSRIWDRLLVDFGKLTKTVHSQRTFTGYQVESKGSYTTTKITSGGGLVGLQINLHPVAANNFKCGGVSLSGYTTLGTKYAWSNANANPLGDLEDLYNQAWRTHLLPKDPSKSVFRMAASAYEILKGEAEEAAEEARQAAEALKAEKERKEQEKIRKAQEKEEERKKKEKERKFKNSIVGKVANSAVNTIGREVGRSLIRGILGSLKRS